MVPVRQLQEWDGFLPAESFGKGRIYGNSIPGGKFELIDVNDKVIESADTVGELVYYGNNVTLGYANIRFGPDKRR